MNVKMVFCKDLNCGKHATFGEEGTKSAKYCKEHSPDDYVDVTHKTCLNCNVHPNFGKQGTKIAEYCSKHAPANYVNVNDKTCLKCTVRANFGEQGTKSAKYCRTHRPINYVDVTHRKCLNCNVRTCFGRPGYQSEYCAIHKKEGMVLNSHKYKGEYIICEICLTKIHYEEQYCSGCKYYLDNGKTRNRNKKEFAIKNLLEENKIEFIHDSTIKGGCSKRRPDFLIHKDWGTIILEIDENQHNRKNYPCECEITRMKQIYFDEGVKNLLFIRYNPDKYKHLPGQKNYKPKERETYLIKYLNELEKHDNLAVVYLFYDGFTNPPEIEIINPYV